MLLCLHFFQFLIFIIYVRFVETELGITCIHEWYILYKLIFVCIHIFWFLCPGTNTKVFATPLCFRKEVAIANSFGSAREDDAYLKASTIIYL